MKYIIRFENGLALLLLLYVYAQESFSWGIFALALLLPDLSMMGYIANPRIGSRLYNLAHTYVFPSLIVGSYVLWKNPHFLQISLIWGAHIALDRCLGYGLKYPTHFKDTTLQRI